MEKHTTIAIDLAKSVSKSPSPKNPAASVCESACPAPSCFHSSPTGPPPTVLLEACGSAHHWAREIQSLGHTVELLPAHHTRRYVLRDKTDSADAVALLEAHRNEQIAPG